METRKVVNKTGDDIRFRYNDLQLCLYAKEETVMELPVARACIVEAKKQGYVTQKFTVIKKKETKKKG